MKHIRTISAAIILCAAIATTFASCSEKGDEPATPAAKSVEGIYRGDIRCTVMGSESVAEDMTVAVSADNEAAVTLTLPAYGEPPMQVPSIAVPGVKVSGSDGVYTLAATEFGGTTDTGKAYSGVIEGDYADGRLTLRWNLTYGAMPMPMIFSFSAEKE